MPENRRPLPRAESKTFEKWLKARAAIARFPLFLSTAAGALDGVLLVIQVWLYAETLSSLVLHAILPRPLLTLMLWVGGVAMARAICQWFSQNQAMRGALVTRRALRELLDAHDGRLRDCALSGDGSGAIAHLVTDGLDAIDGYYASYLPRMRTASMIPVIVLIAAIPIDWVSALIMAATAPIMPVFMVLVGKGAEQASEAQWRRLARLSARVYDALEGMTTLKVFGAIARETQTLARLSEDYRKSTMLVLRAAFLSSLVLEFFATISIAMIAVYVGFRLYAGSLHYQAGLFVLLLAPEFYRPLRNMSAHYHARTEAVTAAAHVIEIVGDAEPASKLHPTTAPSELTTGPLSLSDVSIAHPDRGVIVSQLDAAFRRTGLSVITGPTGAGKTSLLRAILGLQPLATGHIRIGESVLTPQTAPAWHRQVSWLPQSPTILHDTVAANLRLANRHATDDELRTAVIAARADRFIENLPQKFNTRIGGRSTALSGGEKRRLAIARALVKNSRVLILDEPTSHLDRDTAADIIRLITTLSHDHLVIAATHDPALIALADQTIPLNQHDAARVSHDDETNQALSTPETVT